MRRAALLLTMGLLVVPGVLVAQDASDRAPSDTKERLEQQVAEADEILALQQALLERQEKIAANAVAARQAFLGEFETRKAFFEALPREFYGTIQCAPEGAAPYGTPVTFTVSQATSRGLIGTFSLIGQEMPAHLILTDDRIQFPMAMSFAAQFESKISLSNFQPIPNSYSLVMTEHARLSGPGFERSGNDVECRLDMGG